MLPLWPGWQRRRIPGRAACWAGCRACALALQRAGVPLGGHRTGKMPGQRVRLLMCAADACTTRCRCDAAEIAGPASHCAWQPHRVLVCWSARISGMLLLTQGCLVLQGTHLQSGHQRAQRRQDVPASLAHSLPAVSPSSAGVAAQCLQGRHGQACSAGTRVCIQLGAA